MGGYPVKYDFVENVTCITHVEFDPKQTFRKTTASVEELKSKSTLVPKLPSGRIYKYVNLWVGNKGAGDPDSIEHGFIEFKVEKSWIKKENINESLITLQWYKENWQSLDTEKVREDKNYVYFKAETPGYSSFAITEYAGQDGDLKSLEEEIKAALKGEAGKGNSRIKNPIGAARILMAISLPLFMIVVGYCVLKKKI
jgi:clumping factor A